MKILFYLVYTDAQYAMTNWLYCFKFTPRVSIAEPQFESNFRSFMEYFFDTADSIFKTVK